MCLAGAVLRTSVPQAVPVALLVSIEAVQAQLPST